MKLKLKLSYYNYKKNHFYWNIFFLSFIHKFLHLLTLILAIIYVHLVYFFLYYPHFLSWGYLLVRNIIFIKLIMSTYRFNYYHFLSMTFNSLFSCCWEHQRLTIRQLKYKAKWRSGYIFFLMIVLFHVTLNLPYCFMLEVVIFSSYIYLKSIVKTYSYSKDIKKFMKIRKRKKKPLLKTRSTTPLWHLNTHRLKDVDRLRFFFLILRVL